MDPDENSLLTFSGLGLGPDIDGQTVLALGKFGGCRLHTRWALERLHDGLATTPLPTK